MSSIGKFVEALIEPPDYMVIDILELATIFDEEEFLALIPQ